ncbi:MAG: serine/threonine-protein kinase [Gemmataceae bacterium]
MASAPFERDLLGKTLAGKYHLVQVQGAGYYSVVFVAHQLFCGRFVRPVAIKVSRQAGLTDDTAPQLFGDALVLARLMASSDHEGRRHLVQIHDMGLLPEQDDRAYLVMEYVDGQPLFRHMQAAGRLGVATGLRFFKQICAAISLVHEQGAIHRDLIPENILIDRKGDVRVVDFGLAAYADPHTGFVPGATGTFCYMAPETIQGRSVAASDVYSVGLVMYQLFTGGGPHLTAPWAVDDRQDLGAENYRIKAGLEFAPPSRHHNEIRNDYRWLDDVILRCLETDPDRRYPDAAALLRALEAEDAGSAPPAEEKHERAEPPRLDDEEAEALFREVRKLLAGRAYDQVIDRLDVHRPAEWAVVDVLGARTLRAMGQAYLGRGEPAQARECLEQLRTSQRERPLLPKADYAAALSDLFRCYRALGLEELAKACQEEAKGLL